MKYFWAIVFPPVALFMCGKPIQGLLNIILCICTFWFGGAIHAFCVVASYESERRHKETLAILRKA